MRRGMSYASHEVDGDDYMTYRPMPQLFMPGLAESRQKRNKPVARAMTPT